MSTSSTSPDTMRAKATSPPLDPSKLNNQPAPIPIPASDPVGPASPSLRAASSDGPSSGLGTGPSADSAYLDTGIPVEPASHPTIAETGVLATSPGTGPGPKTGQLQRNTEGPKSGERIIRLGSLGGEGLEAKPPPPDGNVLPSEQ